MMRTYWPIITDENRSTHPVCEVQSLPPENYIKKLVETALPTQRRRSRLGSHDPTQTAGGSSPLPIRFVSVRNSGAVTSGA
jgi:hypothetical protein